MDLSVLQVFVEVMRQGSFAAVARDRNVDPSSVSRAIASLEQELGVRLLQRTTRRLAPTEAGLAYFERIEPLIEEMQQAIAIAADTSGQPRGQLRVTTSVAFGHQCIVPLLPEFQALYPDLTVNLLLTDTVVNLLAEGIDVALRLGRLADSTLMAQKLMETRYSVCASPQYLKHWGHPNDPHEVSQHNCLLFPLTGFRSSWRFRARDGQETVVPVQGRTLISSGLALQDCAIAGMGLALLPHWLTDTALKTGTLVNVLPDYDITGTDFRTGAWIVYPSRRYLPLKVNAWIDFLKQHRRFNPGAGGTG
ncbi:LysR family transcriptional regulator [Nodosilinea sp. LEGE 07298]|uniref:LysR family transcriptional regulator n=1 Tax=Nodosilinea sp. LEGE 07298 TaxID=2777970 RepID=UPI00187EDF6A|nr:LysR family transcriptional regulator [Nodosilinea sp. LEGE 07298]MBE9109903.1 LysR family transcriptional regulator [Nodosilinea sp. LEGE 07298]